MLAKLIGGFVIILVGVSLLPVIHSEISRMTSSSILINLIPGFFALGICSIALWMVYTHYKDTFFEHEIFDGLDISGASISQEKTPIEGRTLASADGLENGNKTPDKSNYKSSYKEEVGKFD
jgi:hypothetical protein